MKRLINWLNNLRGIYTIPVWQPDAEWQARHERLERYRLYRQWP